MCVSRRVELEQGCLDWIGNNQVRSGWLTKVGGGGGGGGFRGRYVLCLPFLK